MRRTQSTRDAVAGGVADELLARDRRATSYLDGFGIFRHWYLEEIRRVLSQLEGTAILTEGEP